MSVDWSLMENILFSRNPNRKMASHYDIFKILGVSLSLGWKTIENCNGPFFALIDPPPFAIDESIVMIVDQAQCALECM